LNEEQINKKQDIFTILGTLLGIGFIPIMPGTFGTAAAVLVYLYIPQEWLTGFPGLIYMISAIVVLYFIGVFITGKAEKKLGHDAGSIILDEFVAYFICVLLLPKSYLTAIYTFAIFRVFDIAKPQPIKLLQKLKGGWGVMTDDVLAAVYTNLFMQIMIRIYPRFFVIH
jgi:phosphatidylglycerophosphatase A